MTRKKYIIGGLIFLVILIAGAFVYESFELMKKPVGKEWMKDLKVLGAHIEDAIVRKEIDVNAMQAYEVKLIDLRDRFEDIDRLYLRYLPFTPFKGIDRLLNSLIGSMNVGKQTFATFQECQKNAGYECFSFEDIDRLILNLDASLREFQKAPLFFFPGVYGEKLQKISPLVDEARIWTQKYRDHRNGFEDMFGMNGPRTYLIALQNSAEARPMGGFIGSMIKVSFAYGALSSVEFLDVHYFDYLSGEYIDAPNFLPYIDRMSVQEANIYPTPEASGFYMKEVFEKMGGPNIDGIVFVSLEILDELFAIVPEIQVPDMGSPVNLENYFEVLQWELEKYNLDEYEDVKEPKKVLFDFIQLMGEELKHCDCSQEIFSVAQRILAKKLFQFYFVNPEVKELFDEVGLNEYFGPEDEDQDFFAFYFSNYFNKANRFITKNFDHQIRKEASFWHHELLISLDYTIPQDYDHTLKTFIPEFTDLLPKSQKYIRDVLGVTGVKSYLEVFFPKDARNIQVENVKKEDWYERNFSGYPGIGMKLEFGDFGNTLQEIRVRYTTGVKNEDIPTRIHTQLYEK